MAVLTRPLHHLTRSRRSCSVNPQGSVSVYVHVIGICSFVLSHSKNGIHIFYTFLYYLFILFRVHEHKIKIQILIVLLCFILCINRAVQSDPLASGCLSQSRTRPRPRLSAPPPATLHRFSLQEMSLMLLCARRTDLPISSSNIDPVHDEGPEWTFCATFRLLKHGSGLLSPQILDITA